MLRNVTQFVVTGNTDSELKYCHIVVEIIFFHQGYLVKLVSLNYESKQLIGRIFTSFSMHTKKVSYQ